MDDLEQRLQSHARAFKGLMSLIPAEQYYARDNSDQWSRKKKTKEEKRAAKRAKLDPGSYKSAKDIMDENERKRKRELGLEDEDPAELDAPGKERPREGMKPIVKKQKKQDSTKEPKTGPTKSPSEAAREREEERAEKAKAKAESKAEKRKEKLEKKKEKEMKMNEKSGKAGKAETTKPVKSQGPISEPSNASGGDGGIDEEHVDADEIDRIDVSGLVETAEPTTRSTATPSPVPESPVSATSAIPSTSSSSSIVPPAEPVSSSAAKPASSHHSISKNEPTKPEKIPKLPTINHELLKARLQARIEQLRAARKADGLNGKPAKNRQELLEARRRKQEQRKAHKKEIRKQAKEDEKRAATEAELAQLRGSDSPLTSSGVFSPVRDDGDHNFAFGRVKFGDGDQMDSNFTGVIAPMKKKGPPDAKTALEVAERKQARIASLDEAKRADISEKDAWLNAKKKAHGERVRDDTNLLKKTLKRKEKQKQKSEKEWNDRIKGVEKSKELRQKKREENLRKRKEEKGSKKGKGGKKTGKKPKGRPGFEGSFRSKAR